jgi:hypothetical protein
VDTGFALRVLTGSAVAGMFPVATPAVRRSRTRPSVWLVAVVIAAGAARTGSALATTD